MLRGNTRTSVRNGPASPFARANHPRGRFYTAAISRVQDGKRGGCSEKRRDVQFQWTPPPNRPGTNYQIYVTCSSAIIFLLVLVEENVYLTDDNRVYLSVLAEMGVLVNGIREER